MAGRGGMPLYLQKERVLPLVEWEAPDGRREGTRVHWQRRDMLVGLLHPQGCARCTAVRAALEEERAGLSQQEVALVLAPANEGPAQKLAAGLGLPEGAAALVAADRFGRLYAQADVHALPQEELLEEVLGWMRYAQSRCEECAPPLEWPL